MSLNRLSVKYFKMAVGLDNIRKETDVDISARCPICGDSRTNKRKARLHLYVKNGIENCNCFNGDCACHNKTVYSFLRDFFPSLLTGYKKENFSNTVESLSNGDVFTSFKKEKQIEKVDIVLHDLSPYMTNVSVVPEALNYIEKRGHKYNADNYGQWYYGHQDLRIGETLYKINGSIIIPLYYDGKMYGFYSRSISNKTFYTYMDQRNIGYKIWNWFNIDKNEPVYIFEGIFDAIASGLKNSIALMGAKLPNARLKELKKPVFVLDNDRTGLLNSLGYSKQGCGVYVQPNNFKEKDMNELLLNHPSLNVPSMIKKNVHHGISAEVRIQQKI